MDNQYQYQIKLGLQTLKVGEQLYWIHQPNCNLLLKTDGNIFEISVLVAEYQDPKYTYVTQITLEDSVFYVQYNFS